MTRRDLQRMMGDQQKPWELGKAFDQSAVITHLQQAAATGHLAKGAIWLKLNGETKQSSDLDKMIWNVAEQIANLSQYYELVPATSSTRERRRTSAPCRRATSSMRTSMVSPT